MTPIFNQSSQPPAGKLLRLGLWTAQVVVFLLFVVFGCMKLFMPVATLAAMWVWPGEVPPWFLHFNGIVDLAGGIGVLLPSASRIQPRLTVLAALGCVALQITAIIFHVARGEIAVTPLNFILLALSAFIFWGRNQRLPIQARA